MVSNAMVNELKQYGYLLEATRLKREKHLKDMFCLMFPKESIIEAVNIKGLPTTIFMNTDEYYCLNDQLNRYFKIIPLDNVSKGQVVFKWDEVDHRQETFDIKEIQKILY